MSSTPAISWNKRVWLLAGPIIISNVSVPLLGVVDTAVVGRLPGPEFIGAVAVGAVIFNVIYWAFGFLRMGTTGFTAQALGRNNVDDILAILGRGFVIAIFFAVTIWILQWPLKLAAFALIETSDQVRPLAEAYFDIRIWAAPAALMNYALLGWFIGVQNTKAALISQLFLNVLNMVLDVIFVLHLEWGVEGVAFATVIAEYSALGVGLYLMKRHVRSLNGHWRFKAWINQKAIQAMMTVNGDIFIRTLCLQAAFVSFTAVGSRIGDVELAANAVLLLFQSVMAYGLDGFAFAAESLAGQAYGAKKRRDFDQAMAAATRFAVVLSIAAAFLYWALGPTLINAITTVPEVRNTAKIFLIWAIASPVISVWSFMLDGIFIGCTKSAEMRNAMIASLIGFGLVLSISLPLAGNHGLWFAFLVFMALRAVTLCLYMPRLLRHFDDNSGPGNKVSV